MNIGVMACLANVDQVLGTMQVHWEYTRLLLWPAELSCDYSPKCLVECTVAGLLDPATQEQSDAGGLAACVLKPCVAYSGAIALLAWAVVHWRRSRAAEKGAGEAAAAAALPLFAVGLCAITIAPVRLLVLCMECHTEHLSCSRHGARVEGLAPMPFEEQRSH